MTTIGVIGMGAMGAAIAARLVENGATVLTELAGRSEATVNRAKAAGVEITGDSDIAARSEIILSVIPPSSAGDVAGHYRQLITANGGKAMFIDINAIAPQTMQEIAEPYLSAGLPVADGSIIGGPPKKGTAGPRIYLSGNLGNSAETLKRCGLDIRVLSENIGDASALKMSYAGITKGMQALSSAMAIGAARQGALDSLVEELKFSQGPLYAFMCQYIPGMYAKAYRWDGEMREIARFLEPEAGSVGMLSGAADLYVELAKANSEGPDSEMISILNRFVGKA
jgi:3-hydroxyisobutyrate dehydrogenase-like beta-hydroxyacid dehydrogenase